MTTSARKKKYKDVQDKREGGQFWIVPWQIIRSQAFRALTPYEKQLFFDLLSQYDNSNNGSLCAAWTLMQQYGWKSRGSLFKALQGLLDKGWIVLARQGGMHRPNLYALTCYAIDECRGKDLEIAPTRQPTGEWKRNEPVQPLMKTACAPTPHEC